MYKNKKMIITFFIIIVLAFSYVFVAMPTDGGDNITGKAFFSPFKSLRNFFSRSRTPPVSAPAPSDKRIARRTPATIPASVLSKECFDSDGLNLGVKGYVQENSGSKVYDKCVNSYTVDEGFCDVNDKFGIKPYSCPNTYECQDGACIKEKDLGCIDSDVTSEYPDGKNFYQKGLTKNNINPNGFWDKCVDWMGEPNKAVEEQYCTAIGNINFQVKECPNGCENGACKSTLTGTYKDGDAYIDEDINDPDWVWDISNGYVGIENRFSVTRASENPPGISECFYLPNKHSSVCFSAISAPDYLTTTIEYADNEDLAESGHPEVSTSEKTIHIQAPGDERFELTNGKYTSEIWLAKVNDGLAIFYNDPSANPRTIYWKTISSPGEAIANDINFGSGSYDIYIDMPATVPRANVILQNGIEWIAAQFTYNTEDIVSLGQVKSNDEVHELSWIRMNPVGDYVQIGTKDEDHRTIFGTIIKDPKTNGGSDRVVLEIPGEQIKAYVLVKLDGDNPVTQIINLGSGGLEGIANVQGDVLNFGTNSPSVETSLTSSDDDYESGVFMEARKKAIKYNYDNKFSIGETKTITFLGQEMKVTLIDATTIKVE